ncbi:hypothetical protein PUN28_008396 [Cardiocondyla obscurior]|uniref:Secreted protein n=1 Tax=Cardiocondyla obscurior TaxID=286306 RepID=A0AAW2FZ57_9HYME
MTRQILVRCLASFAINAETSIEDKYESRDICNKTISHPPNDMDTDDSFAKKKNVRNPEFIGSLIRHREHSSVNSPHCIRRKGKRTKKLRRRKEGKKKKEK